LAYKNNSRPATEKIISVADVVKEHWKTFGRNYYSRYDYEECDTKSADKLMAHLKDLTEKLKAGDKPGDGHFELKDADEFEYKDPVDNSISSHQGFRFMFKDGSRFVFRLSGTGSVGATIRLYLEKYESDPSHLDKETQDALGSLIKLALDISQIQTFTGRNKPTVIT